MITPGSRLRQIGWAVLLMACVGLFLALSFRVHSVRSQVLLAERQIIALERETLMLETEFQTRASQRQLASWNTVEFGYQAPRPDQYFASERQLASLSVPSGPSVPSPVRFARNDAADDTAANQDGEATTRLAMAEAPMVSPLTGRPVERASSQQADEGIFVEAFSEILSEAATVGANQARSLDARALNAASGEGRNYLSAEASE